MKTSCAKPNCIPEPSLCKRSAEQTAATELIAENRHPVYSSAGKRCSVLNSSFRKAIQGALDSESPHVHNGMAHPFKSDVYLKTLLNGENSLCGRSAHVGGQTNSCLRSNYCRSGSNSDYEFTNNHVNTSNKKGTVICAKRNTLAENGDIHEDNAEFSSEETKNEQDEDLRRHLYSLETMYEQIIKLLSVKSTRKKLNASNKSCKKSNGSVSSVQSFSNSRVMRDRSLNRGNKSMNKRFQRLESHVVTLARSVAHLSSEMRIQHLIFDEIEAMRAELSQLRTNFKNSSFPDRMTSSFQHKQQQQHNFDLMALAEPLRVKKLRNFFGTEPPLLQIFLKKLGYEKYASHFELEKIGIIELPYVSEERMQKMGIPMGPRLRIMQEVRSACRLDLVDAELI